MNHHIYAIYDTKAEIYLTTLMLSHNDVQPVRQFTDAVRDPKSIFNAHAQDFDLHKIGTFNLSTGELIAEHQLITQGIDLLDKQP